MSPLRATELARLVLSEPPGYDPQVLADLGAVVTKAATSLRLHSVEKKRPEIVLRTDRPRISTFFVSRHGQRVAWSLQDTKKLFTAAIGPAAPTVELEGAPYHLNCVAISGDGRIVAAGGSALTEARAAYESELRYYEAGMPYDYGEYRPEVRPDPGFGPGHVRVWDLSKGRSVMLPGHRAIVSGISLNHDGSMVAAFDAHAVRVWDVASTLCRVHSPLQNRYRPQAFMIVPGGDWVLAGDVEEVWRYDTKSTHAERVFGFEKAYSNRIAFDARVVRTAVGFEGGVVRVFENGSGKELGVVEVGGRPDGIGLSVDGEKLVVLSGNTLVVLKLAERFGEAPN